MLVHIKLLPIDGRPQSCERLSVQTVDGAGLEVTRVAFEMDLGSGDVAKATVDVLVGSLDIHDVEGVLFTTIGGCRYQLVRAGRTGRPLIKNI